jgi:TRAP-type transport system periplasmic protein
MSGEMDPLGVRIDVNERHTEKERKMKPSNFFLIHFVRKVVWSRNLLRFSNCALLVGLLLFPVAALCGQTIEWQMATEYPATSMPGEGLRYFAEKVELESAGRIKVATSFDAQLGFKSSDMIKAVRDGHITAGDAFVGALGKLDPLFLVSSLPFLATTNKEAHALGEAAKPFYAKRLGVEGQRLLYATPWPPSGIWAKKPIVKPADLLGLAMRTYDVTGEKVFTAAGAAAVKLSFTDTKPRLANGSIVAVLSSGDGGAKRKLWKFLPCFTEINYAIPLSLTFVGNSAYDGLPESLRRAVDRAAEATQAHQWEMLEGRLSKNYSEMASNGVVITKVDALTPELLALLSKSADQAIGDWKKEVGPQGVDLLRKTGH